MRGTTAEVEGRKVASVSRDCSVVIEAVALSNLDGWWAHVVGDNDME